MAQPSSDLETVLGYHRLSKHRLDGYAPGPRMLDWEHQPDPFRRFRDAPVHPLGLRGDQLRTRCAALMRPAGVAPHPVTDDAIAVLLELSMGLSAWKRYGETRWALRCNPSSGNLHPTEAYVAGPQLGALPAGVHHYVSHDHALEHRAAPDGSAWTELFGDDGLLVGLTSITWREAWKYGVRAYRYCQHDVGHAIAAVRYAAAALGWRARLLQAWGDDDIARLLGIARPADFRDAEHESPDVMLWVGPRLRAPDPAAVKAAMGAPRWWGRANRLSQRRVPYRPIDEVEKAARKRAERPPSWTPPDDRPPLQIGASWRGRAAAELVRARRSAVAMDGRTRISKVAFGRMLDVLLPRAGVAPWDALPWSPRVHPVLFVHRVDDLAPGLYALPRSPAGAERLRGQLRDELIWERVQGMPEAVDLRLLVPIDTRSTAATIACHQDIAADGAFALGMLAELESSLDEGTWWYRALHWETGVLGQALYLQAELEGVRATGIGCFFDDVMHDLLGIEGTGLQTLYHFTVGGAVDDPRLRSEPAYAHLADRP